MRRILVAMQKLGGYELFHQIRETAAGTSWLGRRAAPGGPTKVAHVFWFATDRAAQPQFRERCLAEARLAMLLSHSNIVQLFDVREADDELYVVSEWVDGLSLAQLVGIVRKQEREPFSRGLALYVTAEVLRGLAYAATITYDGAPLGVVHGAVGPHHVLVSVSGEVKLRGTGWASTLTGASGESTGLDDLRAVGRMLDGLLEGQPLDEHLELIRQGFARAGAERGFGTAEDALSAVMEHADYGNESRPLARLARAVCGMGSS